MKITLPNTTTYPLDQVGIQTAARIKASVCECPPDQLDSLPHGIRQFVMSINHGAKPDRYAESTADRPRYNPSIPTCSIKLDSFSSINLQAEKLGEGKWLLTRISLNPGTLHNGHNGAILRELEFLHSLSTLIEIVTLLLEDPGDWIHIVPGLHREGRAFWRSLEIPFHVCDDTDAVRNCFSMAKHRDMNLTPSSPHGDSITFATANNKLVVRIYRKDLQMRKKIKKHELDDNGPVLRIETKLETHMLERYLKSATWKQFGDKPRLVSFKHFHLKEAHNAVMSGFHGAFTKLPSGDKADNDNKLGRMLGWCSLESGIPLPVFFDHYRDRFLTGLAKGTINNARSRILTAARNEMELLSTVDIKTLFSDQAWCRQQNVSASNLESMTRARYEFLDIHPTVRAVYGEASYSQRS